MTTIPAFSVRTIWGLLTLPAVEIQNKARMLEILRDPKFKADLNYKNYICLALQNFDDNEAWCIENALETTVDGYISRTLGIEWHNQWSNANQNELFRIRLAWCMHIANELEKRL